MLRRGPGVLAVMLVGIVALSTVCAADDHEPMEDYKALLTELYTKYNPAKLGEIDEILRKYAGREREVIDGMQETYEGHHDPEAPDDDEAASFAEPGDAGAGAKMGGDDDDDNAMEGSRETLESFSPDDIPEDGENSIDDEEDASAPLPIHDEEGASAPIPGQVETEIFDPEVKARPEPTAEEKRAAEELMMTEGGQDMHGEQAADEEEAEQNKEMLTGTGDDADPRDGDVVDIKSDTKPAHENFDREL